MIRAGALLSCAVWLAAAVVVALGAVLCFSQVSPENLVGADAYRSTFTAHGAVALALFPLLLVEVDPRTQAHRGAWWIGAAGAVCAGIASVYLLDWGSLLLLGAGILGLAALTSRQTESDGWSRWVRSTGLAWVGVAFVGRDVVAVLEETIAVSTSPFLEAVHLVVTPWVHALQPTLPLAVALAAIAASRTASPELPLRTFRVSSVVAATALLGVATLSGAMGIVLLAAALVVGVLTFHAARLEGSAWSAWATRLQALAFVEAVTLWVFLGTLSVDGSLHDTVWPVAVVHLFMFSALSARLRRLRAVARSQLACLGLALIGVGSQLLAAVQILMGSQGMPRRYASYTEFFVPHHLAAASAAGLFLVGVIALAIPAYRLRRASFGGTQ